MTNDVVVGKVMRGKKQDGSPAAYFDVLLYEVTKYGELTQIGETTIGEGKKAVTIPKFKISAVVRIAESSLQKMASGQSKMCNVYCTFP